MIKIAMIQMCASGSKEENLATIQQMVKKAVEGTNTLDLVCLPECCYVIPTPESSPKLAEKIPGPFTEAIARLAKTYGVNISAGSYAEKAKEGKIYNTSLFFNREGKMIGEIPKDAISWMQ